MPNKSKQRKIKKEKKKTGATTKEVKVAGNKLLGLNIIVGPGEEKELERCLLSVQGDLFDEIVVTITSEDEKVKAVAEKYADIVPFFKWEHHFANARNYSFSKNTSMYIFWLDADDVVKAENYKKIEALKPNLHKYDIVLMNYIYSHDEKDQAQLVLPRERLVKNTPEIKWHDPIHEYLNMDPTFRIHKTDINIDHYRVKPFDPQRNLILLKEEYDKGNSSSRIQFYYGKELADTGDWDKALEVLEPYVNAGQGYGDNLTVACIRLSSYYMSIKNYEAAKNFALKGVRYNPIYAENYVTLGDIFKYYGDVSTAIKYYKDAMTKKLEGGMSQVVDYYGFQPAAKLAEIYMVSKDYDLAKEYCEKALSYKPDHPQVLELKKSIAHEFEKYSKDKVLDEDKINKIIRFLNEMGLDGTIERNYASSANMKIVKKVDLDIVWLVPNPGQFDPALRIRRLNIDEKLKKMGVKSRVVSGYHARNMFEVRNEIGSANVVVFSQYSQYDLELIKHLKKVGIKTIRDHCEGMFGFPYEDECFKEADAVCCCSTKLEEMTNQHGIHHTRVIKDAIEERFPKKLVDYSDRYEKPRAVFMGGGGNSFLVSDVLKPMIDKAGYDLVLMTEWDNADIKWNEETWPDDFCSNDVSLCPQRVDVQPAKSNVKATTAMGLGIPVLGSPIQSYTEVIEDGKNGYVCQAMDDWYKALVALKDPAKRKEIGEAGKASVEAYSLESITKDWIALFADLANDRFTYQTPEVEEKPTKEPNRDLVDIVITNYNNPDYLKLCISSILLNTLHPFHIIVSDGGSDEETWKYLKSLKGITVLGDQNIRKNFSETCNAGINHSRSKYFLILNSDVIVSKGWLTNMVKKMETVPRLASCGVLSNCDRGWLHNAPDKPSYLMKLEKSRIDLIPGMKIDTMKDHVEELYVFMDKSNKDNKDKFTPQTWVAAYATIFARSAVNEVGLFDTQFQNGCEDLDLCQRLSKSGFVSGQSIDSFVYHFGGVSRSAYQEEGKEQYDKEDAENHLMYKKKWEKKKIAIYTGPAWEPWDRKAVDEGMAGSETWASYLPIEFVKRGYETYVYNDLKVSNKKDSVLDPVYDEKGNKVGDVIYRDHTQMMNDLKYAYIDYFICSRTVEPFRQSLHSGQNYVMIHDVWINGDKNYDIMTWKIQKYAYLSDWHKDFLIEHHKMPQEKMFLTANGVVQDLYKDVGLVVKKNQMVYSSSPDRGLYQLLEMFPRIREQVPDFTLKICYGFFNWESSAKQRNDVPSMNLIKKIKELMKQPGVEYLDRVNKETLAGHQMESKIWAYPTWFAETFCCLPDNEIVTDNGIKNIVDVSLRDRALTHRNRYRRIEKVMSRKYNGPVIGFKIQNHGYYTGYYTPEHPIECLSGVFVNKMRRYRKSLNAKNGPLYSIKTLEGMEESPDWKSCKDVNIGDYVHVPIESLVVEEKYYDLFEDMKRINSNYREIKGRITYAAHRRGIPRKLRMDSRFFRFLGLYLAEGSFAGGTVNFAFHTKEKEYHKFIGECLTDIFGINPYKTVDGNTTSVKVNSYPLGRWLHSMFNGNARQKKIPQLLFTQNEKIIKSFIRGVFEGDGYKGGNEHKVSLASKEAIIGLMRLCHKVGLHPNHGRNKREGRYYYYLGLSNSLWACIMNKEEYKGFSYHVFFEYKGNIYYKVKEIKKKKYKGYVYNLEVENDHSYVSNNIAVHNCIGAVENGLSKNAVLTTSIAGLETTAKDAAIMLPPDGLSRDGVYPDSYKDKFVEEAVKLLKDDDYRNTWVDKAYTKMKEYTWENIADKWIKVFEG